MSPSGWPTSSKNACSNGNPRHVPQTGSSLRKRRAPSCAKEDGAMGYYRGDYYRGDYRRGDPGFFDFIKSAGRAIGHVVGGAIGGFAAGGPAGAIAGAVGGAVS